MLSRALSAALTLCCAFTLLITVPAKAEEIKLPILKAPVQVAMDTDGVWHIKGQSDADVLKVQGYMVAKYRLIQADTFRRKALGTEAEIYGKRKVENDFKARFLLVWKTAPKIYEMMSPEARATVDAFTEGMNAFINSPAAAELPSYKKLGVKPSPWRPTDTIAIGRAMSWRLSGSFPEELMIGMLRKTIGTKKFDDLAPTGGIDPVTIVKAYEEAGPDMAGVDMDEVMAWMDHDLFGKSFSGFREGVGSNNWVIGGSRTKNGRPLLANDPHLSFEVAPIWIQMHLTSPTLNVAGVTFAGTPGVVIGYNDNVAWGVTTTGYDVTDAYLLSMNPRDNSEYKFDGEYRKVTSEDMVLKYWEDGQLKQETRPMRFTHFGPIALERDSGVSFGKTVAFRWTGHEPTLEIEAFFGMNKAKNLAEYKKALSNFKVGAQNFVYCDNEGNVLYWAHADVPIRRKGAVPYVTMDGDSSKDQWQGYIPYDELPKEENPERGYVATANNRPAPLDYPYYIGRFFDGGLRARRITDLILETEKHDPQSFMKMQMDNRVLLRDKFLPTFVKAMEGVELTGVEKAAFEQVKNWDGHTHVESLGAALFFKWLKYTNKLTFDEFQGDLIKQASNRIEVFGDLLRRTVEGQETLPWYDIKDTRDKEETLADLIPMAFPDAVKEMVEMFGDNPNDWTWGKIHQVGMGHPVREDLRRPQTPGPGAYGTVNNAGFGFMGGQYNYGGGPSVRMVMEPRGEPGKGFNVWTTLPGADIQDWRSPDAVDLFPDWLAGNFRPLNSDPNRADQKEGNKRTFAFKP